MENDVCFKQRAVDKFPVAEKKLVTNIHKRLQNIFDTNALYRSTVSICVSQIAGSAKQIRQVMGKAGTNYPVPDYIAHVFVFLVVSSVDLQISPLRPSPCYAVTDSQSFRFSVKIFRLPREPEKFLHWGRTRS
jgi:hypothetical protein